MSEKIFIKDDTPEELILVKQLIDVCKLDDARHLLRIFEEKGGHALYDIVFCHFLKCKLLLFQGLYEDLVKLAEKTYKESLGLGKNFLSVDILLIMANALIWLNQNDRFRNILKQGEELLEALPHEMLAEYKQREAYIAWLKGRLYVDLKDADLALKYYEQSLALREEYGTKLDIAISLGGMSRIFVFFKADYNRAIEILERSKSLILEIGNKWGMGNYVYFMGVIHKVKGEIEHSIKLFEQGLTIFNDLNNKRMVASILNHLGDVYRHKGELDRALECLEQALTLRYESGHLKEITLILDKLIQILIDKSDLEQAQQYLHRFEQLSNQLKDKESYLVYLLNKALILKKSSRTRKRAEAEVILKQILEDDESDFELILTALTNLCELLLSELLMANDLEVLEEINPLIARLLDNAEKTGSYSILCETYLLQAKLSLLTFNIKKAKRFLTQAQQISEKFGLNILANKIATENEDLLKKLDLWEELKEREAPMADRLELARLDEKIVELVYNRALLAPQVTEMKVAISKEKKICLVCRGEVLKFSYICNCGAIYCENCARTLTNMENVCWVCDTPIDSAKSEKERVKDDESKRDPRIVEQESLERKRKRKNK
ncbi:MAG: tetratricopeptide repeat protein [Promethearchaeota archaeon]|jgi:tetratricopeptide (TPR) repeat protein